MGTAPITLLAARTTDGTPGGIDWNGGPGLLSVYGTFGTGTVQIAYSPDGGTTYIDTEGLLLNAANTILVQYPAGKIRATVASAGGGTSLNAKLQSTRPPSVAQGNDSFTKLLLHCDDVETYVDKAAGGHSAVFTPNGTPLIDTAIKKFGSASINFGGTTFMTSPDHVDWHIFAGDATIDFWVYLAALPSVGQAPQFISQRVDSNNYQMFRLWNNGGTYQMNTVFWSSSLSVGNFNAVFTPNINQWDHYAYERQGSNFNFYYNGTKLTTAVTTAFGTVPDYAAQLSIGAADTGAAFVNGRMDEIRMSKGIARYGGLSFSPRPFAYG